MTETIASMQLVEFLEGPCHNQWLSESNMDMQIYVRKNCRVINEQRYTEVLDLANVEVRTSRRRQGILRTWMVEAEVIAKEHGIKLLYVESILNPHMVVFLRELGFQDIPDTIPVSMYKLI